MVIRRRKHKRVCDNCGESFTTYNIEQFYCSKCSLKGTTYKPKLEIGKWKERF